MRFLAHAFLVVVLGLSIVGIVMAVPARGEAQTDGNTPPGRQPPGRVRISGLAIVPGRGVRDVTSADTDEPATAIAEKGSVERRTDLARIVQRFRLRNVGRVPVVIERVLCPCSCADYRVISGTRRIPGVIRPGMEFEVEVSLKPKEIAGRFDETFLVFMSGNPEPAAKLKVRGMIVGGNPITPERNAKANL